MHKNSKFALKVLYTLVLNTIKKIVGMIRKNHDHKPQTTQWHREEEPLNHHETPGRQI